MVTAGTNFHHHIQTKHNEGHVLVTSGIYGVLRHPSYFGFFWWAVGTQVVLGNFFSTIFYVLILWSFFKKRIRGTCRDIYLTEILANNFVKTVEEKHLTKFFGNDYTEFRARTTVGIPFIP